MLKTTQFSLYKQICKAILELNKLAITLYAHTHTHVHMVHYIGVVLVRIGALSGDHQVTFSQHLIGRYNETEKTVTTHPLRLEILKTLKKLGQ